jgi:hypothetical protein
MLALLVTIFLFGGENPVWHDPFDIDRAIWFSYAPIPLLVAAALWWSKRLSIGTLFLNTLEIVLTKFALTYCIAMALWATFRPPAAPLPPKPSHPAVVAERDVAPEPTPWPADKRGRISGAVTDKSGNAIPGALVFVSAGLEDMVFELPSEPLALVIDQDGFSSPLMVARRWQPLRSRSADGRLHTLLIEGTDRATRAVPLLPSGAISEVRVSDVQGIVPVHCTAHRKRAHLAVLNHPFHARTDTRGRYALDLVPALELTLSAWTPAARDGKTLRVRAQSSTTTDFSLSP